MKNLQYAVRLTPDEEGGFVVTCRDIPSLITQGDTDLEALAEAMDAMGEALAGYIDDREPFPKASRPLEGEYLVSAPILIVLKARLRDEMESMNLTGVQLAHRLKMNEKVVRRLLDPRHASTAASIERALTFVGARVVVSVQPTEGYHVR